MNLETMVKCLADHYAWNDEVCNLRTLAETLKNLSDHVHNIANDSESRQCAGPITGPSGFRKPRGLPL
jgi:hypothetical protein